MRQNEKSETEIKQTRKTKAIGQVFSDLADFTHLNHLAWDFCIFIFTEGFRLKKKIAAGLNWARRWARALVLTPYFSDGLTRLIVKDSRAIT